MHSTNVLQRTQEVAKEKKIILEEGGSRSSKTYSIFQFFILEAAKGLPLTLTIGRQKLTWVKTTLLKDFEDIVNEYNLPVTPKINQGRQEQIYKLWNTEFGFFGLDEPQKLHGRKQDWVWLNEVMEIDRANFDQLEMRTTTGMVLDYNPYDDTHWVFDLKKRSDVGVVHSTMLDNPFLEPAIIAKIKSYEPTEFNVMHGTADLYMWQVYGLGTKAKLKGAVFNNWDIVPNVPANANIVGYGLDFGYTNDPTAVVEVSMYNNEIYLDELIYQRGMVNEEISGEMKSLGIESLAIIWGDSSEPKSIEEILRSGYYNIKGVEKGPDSINFGIDIMKSYRLHITERSANMESEFRKYKYSEDKNGKSLNKPIDDFNHAIDAARYLIMSELQKKEEVEIYPAGTIG